MEMEIVCTSLRDTLAGRGARHLTARRARRNVGGRGWLESSLERMRDRRPAPAPLAHTLRADRPMTRSQPNQPPPHTRAPRAAPRVSGLPVWTIEGETHLGWRSAMAPRRGEATR